MAEPEPLPVPEPSGQLAPPPRKPPTAIGLVDPGPRPRHPERSSYRRLSRLTRIARLMMGVSMLVGGAGIALVSPVGFVMGVAAISAGTRLLGKTIGRAA